MKRWFLLFTCCFLLACQKGAPNNPHLDWHAGSNTFFSSFSDPPKTLDPSQAYNENEIVFLAQVVDPPLQYSYWKRPYTVEPLALTTLPSLSFEDEDHQPLPNDAPINLIAYSVYTLHLRNDLTYQLHPAFALNQDGSFNASNLDAKKMASWHSPFDFPVLANRKVTADDYAYAIKRLASPSVNSPIYSLMARHIVGLSQLRKQLVKAYQPGVFLDLRQFPLAGVKVVDSSTLQIELRGVYPQFLYWLTMTFFAPMPWEVDKFYQNPNVAAQNIGVNTYPVGSGAYNIQDNSPNRQIVLVKNPYYHHDTYPNVPPNFPNNLQALAGKQLPFIEHAVFKQESEALPRWQKFLQGYYDSAGVGGDLFNQAIRISPSGQTLLTNDLQKKGMRLQMQVLPSVFYFGFNMRDPVVGGMSAKKRALRHAIGIVLNNEYYNQLFLNGQAISAQGPIPPGIFGGQKDCLGMDNFRYRCINGQPVRLRLTDAKALMAQAGYPNGQDPKTKRALRLRFDTSLGVSPDERSQLDWLRQQFAKLGIVLDINVTQQSRFEEQIRAGRVEMFIWGWNADYPDPENFLMLLYSNNRMVPFGGENSSNYINPMYDKLFEWMRNLPNGPLRAQLIAQMVTIVQKDAPMIWLFYPRAYQLLQPWVGPTISQGIANNTLKYLSLNPSLRVKLQHTWNRPDVWPLLLFIVLILALIFLAWLSYYRRQHRLPGRRSYE